MYHSQKRVVICNRRLSDFDLEPVIFLTLGTLYIYVKLKYLNDILMVKTLYKYKQKSTVTLIYINLISFE